MQALTSGVRERLSSGWVSLQAHTNSPAVLRERVAARLSLTSGWLPSPSRSRCPARTITLHGEALDPEARKRALALTEATLASEKVVDELDRRSEAQSVCGQG